jgi:anti-anti-sigma factor
VPDISTVGGETPTRLVVVKGEVVDPPDGTQLYEAICVEVHGRAKVVEVDLSDVEMLGSAGLNALLHAYQDAKRLGCTVTVVAASPFVRRVFGITDLIELLGLPPG